MLKFNNFPPEAPGDVLFSESGLAYLTAISQPRVPYRGAEPESFKDVLDRLQTIGQVIGATVFSAMGEPNQIEVEKLAVIGELPAQFRDVLDDGLDARRLGQALGTGIHNGFLEMYSIKQQQEVTV